MTVHSGLNQSAERGSWNAFSTSLLTSSRWLALSKHPSMSRRATVLSTSSSVCISARMAWKSIPSSRYFVRCSSMSSPWINRLDLLDCRNSPLDFPLLNPSCRISGMAVMTLSVFFSFCRNPTIVASFSSNTVRDGSSGSLVEIQSFGMAFDRTSWIELSLPGWEEMTMRFFDALVSAT